MARSEEWKMRACRTALAPGVVLRQWRRIGGAALAAGLALALAGGGSAAAGGKASAYTGYAFDACNAPKPDSLTAWLASPYRALGIYIGGANRACANAQLSADWTAGAVAGGWSLIPIYVGLQAPCAAKGGLAKIVPASAATQGTAAADDAAADTSALGLPAGSPIYFDMEAYSLHDAVCTQAVQAFLGAWATELHALGYLAGVYGSAASTIRDLQALTTGSSAPDDIWIADWNGQESVFGNPYVSDTLWANHQRLHQYRGGHDETWGGVTINVDSSYVDGAVVSATGAVPPPVVPTAPTQESAPGSVASGDGVATVSWPAGAFPQAVIVTLTPSTPSQPVPGFGNGGYAVQLQVAQTAAAALTKGFARPLTIHVDPLPGDLAPLTSRYGSTWHVMHPLVSGALQSGTTSGYVRNPDGSFDLLTTAGGYFAVLPETSRPPAPSPLTGRFSHGRLVLRWPRSTSASGPAVSYEVTLTNRPLVTLPGETTASIGSLHHTTPSVFRVVATDAAGKSSEPSKPLVVLPSKRPTKLPKILPRWAWQLFDWQQSGKAGPRPAAPRIVPSWYWRWYDWRAAPFHVRV